MMQIRPAVDTGRLAVAFFVQGSRIILMSRILQIDLSKARVGQTVTAGTSRHDTIELVDPALDAFQQIVGRSDTHQITWLVDRHYRRRDVQHAQHHFLGFSDGQPANGIALKWHLAEFLG